MKIGHRTMMLLGVVLAGISLAIGGSSSTSANQQQVDTSRSTVKPVPATDPKLMESWWINLEKNEPESSRALLKIAGKPDEAVAFLKDHMKPLLLEAERLDNLLAKLASAAEADWRPAFVELEYFDPRLAVDLETLMQVVGDSPRRQRMVAVLSGRSPEGLEGKEVDIRKTPTGHNFFTKPGGSWWAEVDVARINSSPGGNPKKKWTRAVRAIVILEHIGTPEAIAILKDMATGHQLAQPTRAAVEALERIANPK